MVSISSLLQLIALRSPGAQPAWTELGTLWIAGAIFGLATLPWALELHQKYVWLTAAAAILVFIPVISSISLAKSSILDSEPWGFLVIGAGSLIPVGLACVAATAFLGRRSLFGSGLIVLALASAAELVVSFGYGIEGFNFIGPANDYSALGRVACILALIGSSMSAAGLMPQTWNRTQKLPENAEPGMR